VGPEAANRGERVDVERRTADECAVDGVLAEQFGGVLGFD
jgi:hypothetical protein